MQKSKIVIRLYNYIYLKNIDYLISSHGLTYLAVSPNHIIYSSDSGKSWLSFDLPDEVQTIKNICPAGKQIYISAYVYDATLGSVYKFDGTSNIVEIELVASRIFFDGEFFLRGGHNGLIYIFRK